MHTDHFLQGIVRLSGNGKHNIAWAQQSEQPDGQCLRSVDNLVAHKCRLRAEDIGINPIEHLAPAVVIAVAAGSVKVGHCDTVLPECIHDTCGIGV